MDRNVFALDVGNSCKGGELAGRGDIIPIKKRRQKMRQTEHTAIVLRYANYRDNDRILTLLSPTRGRIEALARGCCRPRKARKRFPLPSRNRKQLIKQKEYRRKNTMTTR